MSWTSLIALSSRQRVIQEECLMCQKPPSHSQKNSEGTRTTGKKGAGSRTKETYRELCGRIEAMLRPVDRLTTWYADRGVPVSGTPGVCRMGPGSGVCETGGCREAWERDSGPRSCAGVSMPHALYHERVSANAPEKLHGWREAGTFSDSNGGMRRLWPKLFPAAQFFGPGETFRAGDYRAYGGKDDAVRAKSIGQPERP